MPDEIECHLGCPKCGKVWFRVERHETSKKSGVFEHRIVQPDGDGYVPISTHCPACKAELSRV